jgi:NAD(P)-dependent dehydrogenase (short-subunit alcohol dehydrogenase family)
VSLPPRELAGRVAVITGGGRGIGAAIAFRFAAAGARLVIASRTLHELEEVAGRCGELGAHCLVRVADVTRRDAAFGLIDSALERFGRVDVLVNAAGSYGPIGPVVDVDAEEWTRALHVNLLGTLHTCQRAVPAMARARLGSIVNFSGGGATAPLARFSAYGASKAAVVRLTETLALEVAEHGIRVNVIAPGAVDTRLQDAVLDAGARAGELYGRMRALRESGQGGTPVEVPAELALYLASDRSLGLTGRLVSAPHDPWREWTGDRIEEMAGTPWYTLRRLDPHTLGALEGHRP